MSLLGKTIRVAHANPGPVREALLPVIKEAVEAVGPRNPGKQWVDDQARAKGELVWKGRTEATAPNGAKYTISKMNRWMQKELADRGDPAAGSPLYVHFMPARALSTADGKVLGGVKSVGDGRKMVEKHFKKNKGR